MTCANVFSIEEMKKIVFLSHETVYTMGAFAYNGKMLLYSISQSLEKL